MEQTPLLPPRACASCGEPFRPPRKPGRPKVNCPSCGPRQRSKEDPVKNRRRQRRFQAKVTHLGGEQGTAAKKERQERFLVLIASGKPRVESESIIGVASGTVDQWLKRDDGFRRRYRQARAKAKGEWNPEVVPFDASFRERFFHHDTPAHMETLIRTIAEQVEIAEREQARDRRVLILMPPEHGKSTVAVEEYIVYRMAMDPSFRASVVCATQGKARKRLGAISRMLTDRHSYADLIDTYGPFRSEHRLDAKPWTADYITHLKAPAAQRDYSCQALGWTGDIYGDRMDLIVFDDIATLKNQTPAEIEKMWEKTWGECRSRIRKGGLFLVVGTRMREGDIYSVMEDKGFFTDKVIFPAIVEEPSESSPGKALWEEGTSLQELLKLREDDLRMFELMYQQNALPSVGATFTQEMIEACYDDDHYIGRIPEGCRVVAGVDPSVSNYTAGVVFAVSPKGHRYLVDVWNEKGLTGEGGDLHAGVVEFITVLCERYGVKTLAVEGNSWAKLINTSISLRQRLYDLGVNHYAVPIGPAANEAEEHAISQLSGLFNNNLISLPGAMGAKRHPGMQQMLHQFVTWSGGSHHWRKAFDIVKAFRMAEWATKNFVMTDNVRPISQPNVPAFQAAMNR